MSESEERAARLRARIDESEDQEEYAESWRPDAPGDEIAGEIVRYATGHTSYGESRIAFSARARATAAYGCSMRSCAARSRTRSLVPASTC